MPTHKKSNGPGNTARVSNRIAIGMSLLCSSVRANTIHPELMNKQIATNMANTKGDTCFSFLMMGILFFPAACLQERYLLSTPLS